MCAPVSVTTVSASTIITAFSIAQVVGIAALVGAMLLAIKDSLKIPVLSRS
ncbi:hypothetical protein ACO3TA_03185 [Methanocaldococcus sp. 28A]